MFDMTGKTVAERKEILRKIRNYKNRKYKARHKERLREYNRNYYQANKERIAAQKKAAYQAKKGGQDHD